jgi:DNA-binding FadR family transcriptional regulator
MADIPELGPEEIPRVISRALKRSRPLGRLAQLVGLSILRGDIRPGELVTLEGLPLCDLLPSRTQFREAVKVLEGKGLIESKPRRGTRVRPRSGWNLIDPEVISWRIATGPTEEILADFHQMRRGFEPQAAALAARRSGGAETSELDAALEAMVVTGSETGNRDTFVDAAVRFHLALLAATGNEWLASLGRALEPAYVLCLSLSAAIHPTPGQYVALCDRLRRAIAAGSVDAARGRAADLLIEAEEVSMRFVSRVTGKVLDGIVISADQTLASVQGR